MTAAPRRRGPSADAPPPPRKRLGQHFLHDVRVLDDIVAALGPLDGRTVVEIGPGRGALTDRLAARLADVGGRLVAIELDSALVMRLAARYAEAPHVRLVHADVLDTDLAAVAGGPFLLAGNVPYYITTPILFHALRQPRPDVAVYLIQREVADRLVAAPGTAAYGALSVNVQAVARVEFVRAVGRGAFTPPPTVESAVVRVVPRSDPDVSPAEEEATRRFVIACFGARRKQLRRVLRTVTALDAQAAAAVCQEAGVAEDARPEQLAPATFARLARAVSSRTATPAAPAADPAAVVTPRGS